MIFNVAKRRIRNGLKNKAPLPCGRGAFKFNYTSNQESEYRVLPRMTLTVLT